MDGKIILGIIAIICLVVFVGVPASISIFGLTWKLQGDNSSSPQPPSQSVQINPKQLVIIESMRSREPIYTAGSNVTTDFVIKNELGLPYDLKILWVHDEKLYFSWNHTSNKTADDFYVWYAPVNDKGNWVVQATAAWVYQNQSYSRGETAEFEVI